MFSSDYPHWDFDDPRYAFKIQLSDEERRKVFSGQCQGTLRPAMNRHVVGRTPEIPPGSHKIVEVSGRQIGRVQCQW